MHRVAFATVLVLVSTAVTPGVAGPTNDQPTAAAGLDRTVTTGETVYLDAGGSADPDGEIVSYRWTVTAPDGRTLTRSGPRATFEPTTAGRYVVTLQVTDDDGATSSDTAYVDVQGGESQTPTDSPPGTDTGTTTPDQPSSNERPVGRIGGPETVQQGESATFHAHVYDPDGVITEYDWTLDGDGRHVSRTFNEPAGTEVTIAVTATDDAGATREFTKTVTVTDDGSNRSPTAGIDGPSYATVGEQLTFTVQGADPDGAITAREWTAPRTVEGDTLTTTFDQPGNYTLKAAVTDDDGARSWATHTVRVVSGSDDPPVASLSGPEVVMDGTDAVYELEATDPDGGPISVEWLSHPDTGRQELTPGSGGGAASRLSKRLTVTGDAGDTVTVRARVTDDEGNSRVVSTETQVSDGNTFDPGSTVTLSINNLEKKFVPDRATQTGDGDVVRLKYRLKSEVVYNGSGSLTVTWEFDDDVTKTQQVSVDGKSATLNVTHVFISEEGGRVRKPVKVVVKNSGGISDSIQETLRVQSMNDGGDLRMRASSGGETASSGGSLSVPVDRQVEFAITSYQPFQLESGNNESYTLPSGVDQHVVHTYDAVGRHVAVATSSQGDKGVETGRITIDVHRTKYTEYRYIETVVQEERINATDRPAGDGWEREQVVDTERRMTDERRTVKQGAQYQPSNPSDPDVTWVRTGTTTNTVTKTETETAVSRPGSSWTKIEHRAERRTRTKTATKTTWRDYKRSFGIWDLVGSRTTREATYTTSVSRPGPGWSRVGDTGRNRFAGYSYSWRSTSGGSTYTGRKTCEQYVSMWGDRHCISYRYLHRTPQYEDVYRWKGWEYDTEYKYQRTVTKTVTVWAHEWRRTYDETVTYDVYQKRTSVTVWEWKRAHTTEGHTEWSLTEPDSVEYINGTLEVYQRECDDSDGHFDDRMCG